MALLNDTIITLDIDWAPDWIIDACRTILESNNAKATWFLTHPSAAVDRIASRPDLFEIGIHPNCLPNSTHGANDDEVLRHMMDLLPSAVSMRTHSLYQSTPFLAKAAQMGIKNDVSLFLPETQGITPHYLPCNNESLLRLPFFWEDDIAAMDPASSWDAADITFPNSGLMIFDFHPVHIVLNTRNLATYTNLKKRIPLSEWTEQIVTEQINDKPGAGTLFASLAATISGKGSTISEVAQRFRECS